MEQVINLRGEDIRYIIKKSRRARRIRLTMRPNCQITVTMPNRAGIKLVERFMRDKTYWIIEKLEFFRKNAVPLVGLGVNDKYEPNKKIAQQFVQERIARYNQFYDFSYNRICIKNHQHRWGSCSIRKNLNFNYRLIFLPSELADYIIVHELCHLKEMNHSKRFWRLVEKVFSDHREKRRQLRKIVY